MLKAIIEHKNNTLLLEFPCKRMLLAVLLASIGIRTPAHDIKCIDDPDVPIQVKIYGVSEFDAKHASVISSENTLSGVNTWCEIYHNMPYANKLDIQTAVLNGEVSSLREFGQLMLNRRQQDTAEHYYCPLVATVYNYNDYGDLEESHSNSVRFVFRKAICTSVFGTAVMITSFTTKPNSMRILADLRWEVSSNGLALFKSHHER